MSVKGYHAYNMIKGGLRKNLPADVRRWKIFEGIMYQQGGQIAALRWLLDNVGQSRNIRIEPESEKTSQDAGLAFEPGKYGL